MYYLYFLFFIFCSLSYGVSIPYHPTIKPKLTPEEIQNQTGVIYPYEQKSDQKLKPQNIGDSFYKLKVGYFYPQDVFFQKIYHNGGAIVLGEIATPMNKYFNFWAEAGFFYKTGDIKNPCCCNCDSNINAKIIQIPISTGLSYSIIKKSNFDAVIKIGPNYIYTLTTQHSTFFKRKRMKHVIGGTIGMDYIFKIHKFIIDVFYNYRYDKKTIYDTTSGLIFNVYLGGLEAGVGIGGRF